MRVGSAKKKKTRPAGGHESRRAKRHSTNLLSCELGTVGDISATGMRVICPTKPPVKLGQAVGMKLESTGQRLPIKGKVVWIRRKGLRSYQVGIQFIDVSASIAAALESMAMFGFIDLDSLAKKRRGQEPEPQTIRAAFELPDYYKVLGVRRLRNGQGDQARVSPACLEVPP